MNTRMTERDKKLLAGLGTFCVIVFFGLLVILPLRMANEDMEMQIEANEQRITEIQQKVAELSAIRAEYEDKRQQLDQVQEDLYPLLKSQEIDRVLTEQVLSHGLTARKLQITMPDAAANVIGYRLSEDKGSNPDNQDGVWIAQVDLEASGSMASMDRLIDDLTMEMPGVRVTSLSWSSDRRQVDAASGRTQQYDKLSLQLEVLMSRKE